MRRTAGWTSRAVNRRPGGNCWLRLTCTRWCWRPARNRAAAAESKAFQAKELAVYLRDLASTLQNGHNAAERFEGRLSDLHQQYVTTQQDKMNSRLQTLTVISAVFLPLTLLAGIYGMNFENMPELQESYGYPAVLGLMVMIAAVMLYVFYRRGWFK